MKTATKMWTSDRRLYFTADRRITDDKTAAVSLCCAPGGQIPLAVAQSAGLIAATVPVNTLKQHLDELEVAADHKQLQAEALASYKAALNDVRALECLADL